MKSFVALALAGAALAAPTDNMYGPPPPPPAYAASSSSEMAHSSAPMHEETTSSAMAPAYSTSSMEHPPMTTEAPVYSTTEHGEQTYNTTVAVHESDVYVTAIVTSFETYCPKATTVTYGPKTYTVTSATTLTVTDCPGGCHVTCPVKSLPPVTKTYTSAGSTVTTTAPAETVTAVVPTYETVYPSPTTVTIHGQTYTAPTSSATVTVTDCPGGCTVTIPVTKYTSQYSAVMASPAPETPAVYPSGAPASSGVPAPSGAPAATTSGMMPVQSGNAPARLAGAGAAGAVALFGGLFLL